MRREPFNLQSVSNGETQRPRRCGFQLLFVGIAACGLGPLRVLGLLQVSRSQEGTEARP